MNKHSIIANKNKDLFFLKSIFIAISSFFIIINFAAFGALHASPLIGNGYSYEDNLIASGDIRLNVQAVDAFDSFNSGIRAYNNKLYSQAISHLNYALWQKNLDRQIQVQAYLLRGYSRLKIGQLDLAHDDLTTVISLSDDTYAHLKGAAYYGRGNIMRIKGHYDDAIKDYDAAEIYNYSRDRVLYGKALSFEALKMDREMIDALNNAIKINPNNPEVLNKINSVKSRRSFSEEFGYGNGDINYPNPDNFSHSKGSKPFITNSIPNKYLNGDASNIVAPNKEDLELSYSENNGIGKIEIIGGTATSSSAENSGLLDYSNKHNRGSSFSPFGSVASIKKSDNLKELQKNANIITITSEKRKLKQVRGRRHYVVQIAAFKTKERAENALDSYQNKFSHLLDGIEIEIDKRADNNFYNIQAGPIIDRKLAQNKCEVFRALKQDCFVILRSK